MDWFEVVTTYYNEGYYTADQVKVFATKGKITSEQFQQITGQTYII